MIVLIMSVIGSLFAIIGWACALEYAEEGFGEEGWTIKKIRNMKLIFLPLLFLFFLGYIYILFFHIEFKKNIIESIGYLFLFIPFTYFPITFVKQMKKFKEKIKLPSQD